MTRRIRFAFWLLLVAVAHAQHIRTKADKTFDLSLVADYQLRTGMFFGRHPHTNENVLQGRLDRHLDERARASGLRRRADSANVLTYSLRLMEEKEAERRGGKRVEHEATRYELEIRILGPERKPVWTASCTGSVRDYRQKFVEPHLMRAVTLAIGKFPR